MGLYRAARTARRHIPDSEIDAAVDVAFDRPGKSSGEVPLFKVQFNPAKLKAAAAKIAIPQNWRHWLWERSPVRPETQTPVSFISHLYHEGEKVLVFDDMGAYEPLATVTVTSTGGVDTPKEVTRAKAGKGTWYLCNPVDGKFHYNPRQGHDSCRSEESVTSFRYLVMESDKADPRLWLAYIAQLKMRVAAIYSSGGRSLHTLTREDASSKEAWDNIARPFKRPFKVLGGDPGCLSAVRLTRLPGCWRTENEGFQKLLYLNPDPPDTALLELPVIRTRAEELKRWKTICPKWAQERKADSE